MNGKENRWVKCACGCETDMLLYDDHWRARTYLPGHHFKNNFHRKCEDAYSDKSATAHERARRLMGKVSCGLRHIGGCSEKTKRLEIHHLDGDCGNNRLENLVVLCPCHHQLVEKGRLTLKSTTMPDYYVDAGGKRRYKWSGKKK